MIRWSDAAASEEAAAEKNGVVAAAEPIAIGSAEIALLTGGPEQGTV